MASFRFLDTGGWKRKRIKGVRPLQFPGCRPDRKEYWTKLWADPAYRALRKANPGLYTRAGVPHRTDRKTIKPLLEAAERKADEWIMALKKQGILLDNGLLVDGSDDAIAEQSLREAARMALSPGSAKTKLAALNTCLAYTKAKPVTKTELAVKSPEDWLSEAIEASKQSNGK